MSHREEVVEDFGGEVLEADEDAVVSEVVVGGVVEVGASARRAGRSLRLMRMRMELGSAALLVGTQAMRLPRTLRAGAPQEVDFSTLRKVRPVCQTVSRVTMGSGYKVWLRYESYMRPLGAPRASGL